MEIHVVRAGDTLRSIAAQYGIPAGILAGINGMAEDAPLVTGQTIVIRFPREVHTVAPGESVYSIALRYGLGDRPAKTQREIAAQLGISRSYVSRIEKKAIEKLRTALLAAGY